MRAMRAEGFSGYKDLKLVAIPKPAPADGRVLVRITAARVTPLEHTILSGGYPRAAPLLEATPDPCDRSRRTEFSSKRKDSVHGNAPQIDCQRRPQVRCLSCRSGGDAQGRNRRHSGNLRR